MSSSTSWDGTVNLPTAQPLSSITLPSEPSIINTVTAVVEIGFGDLPITFDKAVRMKFDGQTGNRIGYSRGGAFTEITTACSADTQVANDGLPAGSDCKINVGSDLVVWSKHFTKFASFSSKSSGTGPSAGGSSGGGHKTGAGPSGAGKGAAGILEPTKPIVEIIDASAPKIFDVKFQLDNGTKFRSSETTNQYVNDQSM